MHGENTNRVCGFVRIFTRCEECATLSRKGAISRAVSPRIGFTLFPEKRRRDVGGDREGYMGRGRDGKMQSETRRRSATRRTRSDKNTNTWCDTEKGDW